jgi:ACS family glucarate transporter-like MFS transporter/ACS family D-galactonate transporter-like MFS transporter
MMQSVSTTAEQAQRSRTRYFIVAMLFLVTALNYGDRATLSMVGAPMSKQLGLDTVGMGFVFSAFSWAYVIGQIPGGWLLDRFGARRVYAASIFSWSLFTLLQSSIGLLGSAGAAVAALFVLRFAMGAAEAPAFPANAKVVASWFPTNELSTASAIFNAAQYFAAVVFTPLMAWLTHAFGWLLIGTAGGVLGLLLAVAGLAVIRTIYEPNHDAYDRLTSIDPTVVLATLGLSLAAGLVAGLYPAWRIGRTAPAVYLKTQ